MEGNIVVDGVLASCYAGYDHDLAHVMMTPLRWFPETVEWIFGAANGKMSYVDVIKNLGKWMHVHEITTSLY